MSRILRYLACLFMLIFAGNALAAGYSCPSYKKYTSCASGYYMTSSSSGRACNTSQNTGNACRPCSVYDDYKGVDTGTYSCAGDTSCPILSKVTITYNLNGGSGTKPANKLCTKGQTCTLNSGATTSFYRAGYVFKGWALTRTATSGFTSYTFTGSDTVYAVWEECGIGEYKPGSGTQAAAACSSCPDLTPGGFVYLPTTGNTSLTKCIQGIAKAADVNKYCATSSEATEQFDIQCQATSDGTWGDCAIGNTWMANPGSYVGIWKQTMPAEDVIENMCIPCGVGTYSEGGLINSCSACSGDLQYQNLTGQTSCKSVDVGYYKESNSAQEQCPVNYRDIAATSQANCQGTFEKTGSQQTPDMQTGCAERTLGTCSPGTCEYTKKYSGTIVNDCTPTDCTRSQTCTSAEKNYYLDDGNAKLCSDFRSFYPYSDGGNITKSYCYRIEENTGSQVNGPVPDGCRSVDSWYDCEPGTCKYKNYFSATDETCTPKNCEKDPETVVADDDHYVSGTSCPSCPTSYPYSDGGTGGQTVCYKDCSKDCTRQTCPSSAYSCTHGSSSTDGIEYYNGSCDAPSSTCTLTVNSCKSGFYKSENSCASCSDLGDGSYTMSANGNSSGSGACYKSCTRACTRPTCPDNATCSYGSSSTSGTQYYNGSCSAASSTCTMTVTCEPGYYKNSSGTCSDCGGNAYYCPGDNTRYSVDPGHYSTGGKSTTRTGQEECTGAKYCTGGVQKSCPLATYGWTRNGGTGWTSYTQCNQTRAATSASTYCSAGTLKQNATSATAWGPTTVSEALSAKAGAYVNGTTCSQCTANDYCTGGTAERKDCPSGYPNSAAGSDAITDCYSNTKSRPWSGGMVNGDVPTNCSEVTEWGTCSKSACEYVAYSNSAGTADGTVMSGCEDNSENCVRPVVAVAAKSGYYDAGTTCSECPNGYPNSANGNEGGNTKCYASVSGGHYIGTKNSATQSECVGGTYKAAHTVYYGSTSSCSTCDAGTYSSSGAASCTACSGSTEYQNLTGQSSCKTVSSGYYKSSNSAQTQCPANYRDGTGAANINACKTSCDGGTYVKTENAACTAVGSGYYKAAHMVNYGSTSTRDQCPSGYRNSAAGADVINDCYMNVSGGKYVARENATTTATCEAGTYKAAHTVYYGSTSSCSACTGRTKYSRAGASECRTVDSGYYSTGCNTSGNNCTGQSQCTGATYCSGGVKNDCPAQTSGWTRNGGTGWTSYTQCNQTRAATSVSSYCSAGTLKQNATSATAWGATTVSALSAKAGAYVNGQTCSQCTADNYCTGGTAAPKDCPTEYPNSDAGAAAVTSCYSNTKSRPWSGSQVNGAIPSGCSSVPEWNSCSKSACEYVAYANSAGTADGTIKSGCETNAANCTRTPKTVSASGDHYVSGVTCPSCPSGYPNSDGGTAGIFQCYSDEKSRPWVGGQTSCETPAGCSDSTCNICTLPACSYVAYSNSTGSADGAIKSGCATNNKDCQQTVKSVTAKAGRYVSGITCPACAVGTFQGSNDSTATSCSVCPGNTYAASTGMSSCSACPSGYTISGTAASNHDAKSDCSITCAAGTRVVTADAACTTPTGSWYTASHSVAAGSTTPAATVKACLTNYSTPNTTTRTDHDASTDCKISCAAGTRITTENATSCTTPAGNWYVGAHSVAQGSVSSYSNCLTNYTISGTAAANHDTASDCKISCGGGSYIATANNTTCSNVGAGYWAAASTVSQGSAGVRNACDDGLTTIGSGAGADEAGDCGRVLNVNGEKIYLRSTKKTTPSLNVSINGDVFYGNMGASSIGALKLKSNGTTYSVYDDSMQ